MLVCVVGVLDMEMAYPLVNMQKNCGKAPCFMAKSTINGQFSIVTSKCRRVYPLVDNAFLLLCVTYFQMVFVQQAMFVYQLDGCIENDFKRPHPKFFLKLMISEQKKSWPETQAGFTLNVPWVFHGCSMEIPPEMPPHSMDLWGQAQRNCQIYGVGSQDGSSHSAMERWLYKLIIGTCSVICDLYVHI